MLSSTFLGQTSLLPPSSGISFSSAISAGLRSYWCAQHTDRQTTGHAPCNVAIIIITNVVFLLLPWHCMSSPSLFDECTLITRWPPILRQSQLTWTLSTPSGWLLPATSTITIYYYSVEKLLLILLSCGRWKSESTLGAVHGDKHSCNHIIPLEYSNRATCHTKSVLLHGHKLLHFSSFVSYAVDLSSESASAI